MSGETPAVREALAVYETEVLETERVPPGYKQTEPGVIPEDWETTNLGNVVTLQRGYDLPQRARLSGTVPIVSSSGTYDTHNQSQVCGPGVVTGRYGTVGEVFFIEEDFWPLNTTLFVSDFKGNDPLFISYMLRTIDFASHRGKSGVPGVNRNDLHQLTISLPPPPEQRAIATALSDVDGLISALEKLIAKKRAVKTATMQQLLTGKQRLPGFSGEWERSQLGNLGSTYGGITGKTKADFGNGTAKYIPFLNVMNNVVIDLDDLSTVAISEYENQNSTKQSDLLFNSSSETPEELGMCSVLLDKVENVYLNSFCFGLRLNSGSEVYAPYLAYFFRSGEGRKLLQYLAQGATRYNLSKTNFLSLEIPLPHKQEQTAIAAVLSDMDAEIEALEARREKTRRIKQGMMQELLTGRTRLV